MINKIVDSTLKRLVSRNEHIYKQRKFATIKKNIRKSNSLSLFSCYSRLSRKINEHKLELQEQKQMTPEIKRQMQYLRENGNIQTSESIEASTGFLSFNTEAAESFERDNRFCGINPWGLVLMGAMARLSEDICGNRDVESLTKQFKSIQNHESCRGITTQFVPLSETLDSLFLGIFDERSLEDFSQKIVMFANKTLEEWAIKLRQDERERLELFDIRFNYLSHRDGFPPSDVY